LDDLLDEDGDGENSDEESGSESNGESVQPFDHAHARTYDEIFSSFHKNTDNDPNHHNSRHNHKQYAANVTQITRSTFFH
jgi:hypothetical protein